jgi:hypothetical protein
LLFDYEQVVGLCWTVHLNHFNQETAQQISILVESRHQRMSDPVFWLSVLVEYVSQVTAPTVSIG